MNYERFDDWVSIYRFWGWRCVICGEIIDKKIMENRQSRKGKEK